MQFPFDARIENVTTQQDPVSKGMVESVNTLVESAAILTTGAKGGRKVFNGQDVEMISLTISSEAEELKGPNIRLVILSGPYEGYTAYVQGCEHAGPIGNIPRFYRTRCEIYMI